VQNLRRDAAFLYAGAVIPIVLWHMDHTRRFDWFNRDDQFLHAAVGSAGAKVLTSVAGAVAMLMNSKNDSGSGGGNNSTNGGYLPLGRWSSRLWMQEQHEVEGGGCNGHDCYDNARIPSGNANWGDFSATTIALYFAAFTVMLVVVVAREQLEMARRSSGNNGSSSSSKVFPFYSTKHMILVGTWITWAFGVLCPHRVVSLAFLNLFHAAPTFLVTFCAAFNRWLLWCRHAAERSKFIAARWRAGSNGFARDDEDNEADGKRGKNVADESTATTCDPTENCSALDRFALWMLLSSVDGGKNTPFMNKRGGGGASVSSPSATTACSVSFAAPSNETKKKNSNGSSTRTKLLCFCVFLAFLFVLGLAEEYLWETLIWHDYTEELWEFDPAEDFSPPVYSAITALLILPQATHYFLDAFLWKHAAEENPGLALHLGMETARPVPQEWLDMMAT
jgi:hypothetical protein